MPECDFAIQPSGKHGQGKGCHVMYGLKSER